jgi:LacI family transcriptional regulator
MQAIEELSYQPNIQARGLASRRSFVIGMFCDAPAASSNYISRIQTGLLTMCHKEGYHLVIECVHADNPNIAEPIYSLVVGSGMSGAILTPPLCDMDELIQVLQDTKMPIARLSPDRFRPGIVDVNIDNRQAAYDMTAYLLSLGHKRIAIVKGPERHSDARKRFEGYVAALAEAGLPFRPEYCDSGNYTYKEGMEAGGRLLALEQRPTAIFASNDDMAVGVMAAALRCGLSVPRNLSVSGFDDSHFAQAVWPCLTTCCQPVEDMAAMAGMLLTKPSLNNDPGEIRFKHTLVVRGSTAPPLDIP